MTAHDVFLAHACTAFFLTGLIWVVQIVQYPFFAHIASENFARFHEDYRFWITPVVAPAMIAELASGIFLIFYPPFGLDPRFFWLGLFLIAVVWASTFFVQVPLHERLARRGRDRDAIRLLVKTNWLRTAAWTARAALMIYLLRGFVADGGSL